MKTKAVGVIVLLLVCAAEAGLLVARINQKQELFELQQVIDRCQNEKIVQLEKEIRILKTDVHLLQYGFEDENEKADNFR